MIGIIGGNKTVDLFESRIKMNVPEIVKGMRVYTGRLNQTEITMAAGERGRMTETAEVLLERFELDCLIQIDLAMPLVPYLQQGDIVIAENMFQFPANPPLRESDSQQIPITMQGIDGDLSLARKVKDVYDIDFAGKSNRPELIIGTIVSNDREISDKRIIATLQREFGAVAMDVDGATVARICRKYHCSFLGLRAVTESFTHDLIMKSDLELGAAIENLLILIESVVIVPEMTPVV